MTDFDSSIPSKSKTAIEALKASKITKVVRYSWWPPEESSKRCDIERSQVFSFTEGPILFYLESGEVVVFSSEQSINSVILWFEKTKDGRFHEELCEDDPELFPIEIDDQEFSDEKWSNLINQKIMNIKLIIRKPISVMYEDLPNETGLAFVTNNGKEFVICHRLCGGAADLSFAEASDFKAVDSEELSFSTL